MNSLATPTLTTKSWFIPFPMVFKWPGAITGHTPAAFAITMCCHSQRALYLSIGTFGWSVSCSKRQSFDRCKEERWKIIFLKPFLAFNKSKIVLKLTPTNYPTSTFSDIFTTEEEEARLLLWSMIYFIIRNDRNSLANFSKKRLRLIACDYSLCVERP